MYRRILMIFQDGIPCKCVKYFNEFPIFLSYIMMYYILVTRQQNILKERTNMSKDMISVVTKMMKRYRELLETSKLYYLKTSHDLEDYFKNIESHYNHMRQFIGSIYVFGFMTDEEFDTWSDKVFNIYLDYQQFYHMQ